MNLILKTAAVAAIAFMPVVASAAPVLGGTSVIRVLVPLGATQVITLPGSRQLSNGDFSFDIFAGGDVTADPTNPIGGVDANLIHGGGLRFSNGSTIGTLSFLQVDTNAGVVIADVNISGSTQARLPVFTLLGPVTFAELTDLSNPLLQLNLSPQAVALLGSIGIVTDTNQRFGTLATNPRLAQVPAPAAIALFGLGVAGLAFRRR